jgi:hypothetical protein
VGRQPLVRIYLLLLFFSYMACRFGECQPPETARIEADGSLGAGHYSLIIFPINTFFSPIIRIK